MSAKKAVLKVPTLGRKSTNMQLTDFHNPVGQQYNSSLLVWRLQDMPLQAVTCHFFVEVFIIISHVISHCMCSMYQVLTCSCTYVMSSCTSRHPPSDTGATKCIYKTLTALELFLLHQEFSHCMLANKCH